MSWRWLGVIYVLAVALRLYSFGGIAGADDVSIAGIALDTIESGFKLPNSHYALRIALTLPLAGVFSVFGVGDWQFALLPFVSNLAGIGLAFAIGRRLCGDAAGLLAALLLALFPLNVVFATQLFPDGPLGVAVAASFYLALRIKDSDHPYAWAAASGLMWGLAYFIKIEAIFVGAVYLAMAAWDRRNWRPVFLVILVFGAVVAAENLIYLLRTGIWLYQIHVIRGIKGVLSTEYAGGQLWVFPKSWFVTFYDFGLYYYFLAAAAVWTVATRQRRLYLPLVWVGIYLLWLQFGANPFSAHYSPKSHLDRYCDMVSIPVAILVAGLLVRLAARSRLAAYGLALGAIAASALFFIVFNTLSLERQQATKRGVEYALAHDMMPLYLDATSYDIAAVMLWSNPARERIYSIQHHDFATGATEVLDPGSLRGYLLLNRDFMAFKAHRYFVEGFDIAALKAKFPVAYSVDNPGRALAYDEARFMHWVASFVPVAALRDQVQESTEALLAPEDVLIFRLAPPSSR
ncbi:MAG: glycosyltransferase family 39 protein [Alphaproteobacteria bacterium]